MSNGTCTAQVLDADPGLLPRLGDDLSLDIDELMAFEAAEEEGFDDSPLDRYRAATERLRVLSDLARTDIWAEVAAQAIPAMKRLIKTAVPALP